MKKLKQIVFVAQFAVLFIPAAIMLDFIPYMIAEGSVVDGIGARFYDAMLNCADRTWSSLVVVLLIFISLISFLLNLVLKPEDDEVEKSQRKDKK